MSEQVKAGENHDFDWISALHKCSIENQFIGLYGAVTRDVARRNDQISSTHNIFKMESDTNRFCVRRLDGRANRVCFEATDHGIVVGGIDMDGNPAAPSFVVTTALNDEGECRYYIGSGKVGYLRWQIIRKALEGIFGF